MQSAADPFPGGVRVTLWCFGDGLNRKKVRVYDYPDGTDLPYSVFDEVRQVKQADIVSNKRRGSVLHLVKEQQKAKSIERSESAPQREVRYGSVKRLIERSILQHNSQLKNRPDKNKGIQQPDISNWLRTGHL